MKPILSLVALFIWSVVGVFAQEPSLSQSKEWIKSLREIHTSNGIETLEQIELNGAKQWISIRGKDRNNPVLLVLHGGPANPLMPAAWAYQTPWEDFFTVVNWDQRGSGKNWISSDTTQLADELSFRTLVQDAYVLVDYLREKLEKDKIFLMGYSYGSSLGIRMAARIPQKLHAYIGIGQMAGGNPEKVIYDQVTRLAEADGNETALYELRALAPYPATDGSTPMRKLIAVRKWSRYYNGGWYGKPDFSLYYSLPNLSPEYSDQEIKSLDVSMPWITRRLLPNGPVAEIPEEFQIPVFFMMGRHDLHTPYHSVEEYVKRIKAPQKKLVTFEYSGHMPFLEEQGKFLMVLVNQVFPLSQDGK